MFVATHVLFLFAKYGKRTESLLREGKPACERSRGWRGDEPGIRAAAAMRSRRGFKRRRPRPVQPAGRTHGRSGRDPRRSSPVVLGDRRKARSCWVWAITVGDHANSTSRTKSMSEVASSSPASPSEEAPPRMYDRTPVLGPAKGGSIFGRSAPTVVRGCGATAEREVKPASARPPRGVGMTKPPLEPSPVGVPSWGRGCCHRTGAYRQLGAPPVGPG